MKTLRPHITIPGWKQAIILTEIDGLAVGEFALGDPIHGHRVADVQCGPVIGAVCHVECKCGQCGKYPTVPVTTVAGVGIGTTGMQRCNYCGHPLFVLDAHRGIVNRQDSSKYVQINVSIPDAVKHWQAYQAHILSRARQAAEIAKDVREAARQYRQYG
jgi:hypothetical protein